MDAQAITRLLGGWWRNGTGQAACPICQPERRRDQNALSITNGNGKVLLYCFKSRCSFVDIAEAIELSLEAAQIDFAAQRESEVKQATYAANKRRNRRGCGGQRGG